MKGGRFPNNQKTPRCTNLQPVWTNEKGSSAGRDRGRRTSRALKWWGIPARQASPDVQTDHLKVWLGTTYIHKQLIRKQYVQFNVRSFDANEKKVGKRIIECKQFKRWLLVTLQTLPIKFMKQHRNIFCSHILLSYLLWLVYSYMKVSLSQSYSLRYMHLEVIVMATSEGYSPPSFLTRIFI